MIMSNYPLGAENDSLAPYNEKLKEVEVSISVSLSKTVTLLIPESIDESDPVALEIAVNDQIMLPQDYPELEDWIVDDMCII